MNAIFTRRSIRKFTDEPVTDQELEQLLRAGMAAACAKNSQNRLFFVERGTGSLPGLIQVHPNAFALKTAQAAIVVAADRKKGAALGPLDDWWVQGCSAPIPDILVEGADGSRVARFSRARLAPGEMENIALPAALLARAAAPLTVRIEEVQA